MKTTKSIIIYFIYFLFFNVDKECFQINNQDDIRYCFKEENNYCCLLESKRIWEKRKNIIPSNETIDCEDIYKRNPYSSQTLGSDSNWCEP